MGLRVFITTFCITILVLLLKHCSCIQIQVQLSHEEAKRDELSLTTTTLPRKLRFNEEVDVDEVKHIADHNPNQLMKTTISGNFDRKKQATGHEISEDSTNPFDDFFTMDYHRVRRRRPIHNKSLPAGP